MRIGIIGLGMLGNAVAAHLLESNFDLTVYNRTRDRTSQVENKGAKVVNSPKEVAENSDIVITIVRDADAVRQVSFEKDGITDGNHENLTVADMSTIDPIESKKITEKFLEFGIDKLDIPVMGGPNVAISGDLVMMVSGNNKRYQECKKIFEKIAKKVFYLGEKGVAHSVKLAMNLQITMLALSLSEGITLLKNSGVDPKIFLEVLNSTYFKTGMSEKKAYSMIDGKYDPTFTLSNLKKDISIMTNTAENLNIRLPMIKKAEELYNNAIKEGLGEVDYTGIIEYIKKINDVKA